MKRHLAAACPQPATLTDLQRLVDRFVEAYNHHRPHQSLPSRATPAAVYTTRPKAAPGDELHTTDPGRVRTETIDKAGSVTLRHNGKLHHIDIGRIHTGTRVLIIAEGLQIRVLHAITGETLRELTLDPTRYYQPTGKPKGPTRPAKQNRPNLCRFDLFPMS